MGPLAAPISDTGKRGCGISIQTRVRGCCGDVGETQMGRSNIDRVVARCQLVAKIGPRLRELLPHRVKIRSNRRHRSPDRLDPLIGELAVDRKEPCDQIAMSLLQILLVQIRVVIGWPAMSRYHQCS